ncbi:MAG: hypothetical protein SF162_20370 [bacterium]|nr:hypothetical protein [bacterium]
MTDPAQARTLTTLEAFRNRPETARHAEWIAGELFTDEDAAAASPSAKDLLRFVEVFQREGDTLRRAGVFGRGKTFESAALNHTKVKTNALFGT